MNEKSEHTDHFHQQQKRSLSLHQNNDAKEFEFSLDRQHPNHE
jgi:hypothetical protein